MYLRGEVKKIFNFLNVKNLTMARVFKRYLLINVRDVGAGYEAAPTKQILSD